MKKRFIKITKPKDGFTVGEIYPVLCAGYDSVPAGLDLVVFNDKGEQKVFYDDDCTFEDNVKYDEWEIICEEMTEREVMIYNSGYAFGLYASSIECDVAYRKEGHEDRKKGILDVHQRIIEELSASKSEYFKTEDKFIV